MTGGETEMLLADILHARRVEAQGPGARRVSTRFGALLRSARSLAAAVEQDSPSAIQLVALTLAADAILLAEAAASDANVRQRAQEYPY